MTWEGIKLLIIFGKVMLEKFVFKGSEANCLNISFKDILLQAESYIEDYHWCLLWFEATTSDREFNIIEFENTVKQSQNGILISYRSLVDLSVKIDQTLELFLIGDKDESIIRNYNKNTNSINAGSISIELIDSSYWEISTGDKRLIDSFRR